jgi:hypothetical protein
MICLFAVYLTMLMALSLHGVCRTAKFFESKEVEGLWKEAVQG